MPTAEQTTSLYARTLRETLYVRRYTGSPGLNRPFDDYQCRGRVWGERPAELVGSVNQYDYKAVLFVPDLVANGFTLPLASSDKVIHNEKELAITFPDNATRKEGDELIAYEVNLRGPG